MPANSAQRPTDGPRQAIEPPSPAEPTAAPASGTSSSGRVRRRRARSSPRSRRAVRERDPDLAGLERDRCRLGVRGRRLAAQLVDERLGRDRRRGTARRPGATAVDPEHDPVVELEAASLRRSWTARWSSRASPSARSSGVSVVSMIATRPVVVGDGRARPRRRLDLDLVGRERLAGRGSPTRRRGSRTAPSRAAAMTAGILGPSRLPTFGRSTLTPRSTSSRLVADQLDRLDVRLGADQLEQGVPLGEVAARAARATGGASGWRALSPAWPRRVRARSTARRATATAVLERLVPQRARARRPARR